MKGCYFCKGKIVLENESGLKCGADFKSGECSLGYLAEQLGISAWEAYDILEKKGLRTTNL